MAEQVLRARDNGVVFDIGAQRAGGGYAVASLDEDVLAKVDEVLTELQGKLEAGQAVALNQATLDALETINVNITEPLTVDGTVDLGATTLAALETINASVSGTVDVGNAVALDTATLAALEQVTATISGTVSVTDPDLLRLIDDVNANEVFGPSVTSSRHNQLEVSFFEDVPGNLMNVAKSGGATTSQHLGHAHFSTSTGTNGSVVATTPNRITYRPMHEIFAAFTGGYTTPAPAGSTQYIGLFDDNEGFAIGYQGSSFGVLYRTASTDNFYTAFNLDPLDGSAGSQFTMNNSPVAIDTSKTNIYRIRFGWLGSVSVVFEAMSPDGYWVAFHRIIMPNTKHEPSIANPNLPMRIQAKKSGGSTNLTVFSGCMAAGTTADESRVDEPLSDATLVKKVKSILAAKKPNGEYVDIAANNKGRLLFALGSVADSGTTSPTEVNQVGGRNIDGNLYPVNVETDGTVIVNDGHPDPQTDSLTDTELRATPVPVDTGLTTQTDGLTDTELRASPVDVNLAGDIAKDTTLLDVKRAITDYETRLDYDARTDSNPVYVGKAQQGTATATASWTVQKLEYDSSSRLTRVQVVSGIAWDNRAGAF